MITSVIPLPNFYLPMTGAVAPPKEIFGFTQCFTGDEEAYLPMDIAISHGRNIYTDKTFYKYKLEMVVNEPPHFVNQLFSMVIMTDQPLSTKVLTSDPNAWPGIMYPLYARGCNHTYMFIDPVNALYDSMADSGSATKVMSITSFVERILARIGHNIGLTPNDYPDIADVCMDDLLISIISSLAFDGDMRDPIRYFREKYFKSTANIPLEIAMIGRTVKPASFLASFVNPYIQNITEVRNAVEASMPSWPQLQQYLISNNALLWRSTDNVLPTTPEELGRMGSFLSEVFNYPQEDFWFDIEVDERVLHDFYYRNIDARHGFKESQTLMKGNAAFDMSSKLVYAADLLGLFPTRKLVAHRSCMEDVCVYDKNDNTLLLYIDLPMWLLASCNGLINTLNTDYF